MKETVMDILLLIVGIGCVAVSGFLFGYLAGSEEEPRRVYQPPTGPPRPLS